MSINLVLQRLPLAIRNLTIGGGRAKSSSSFIVNKSSSSEGGDNDPVPPRWCMTGFKLFIKDQASKGHGKGRRALTKFGAMWRDLDDEAKDGYRKAALEDRSRFKREYAQYREDVKKMLADQNITEEKHPEYVTETKKMTVQILEKDLAAIKQRIEELEKATGKPKRDRRHPVVLWSNDLIKEKKATIRDSLKNLSYNDVDPKIKAGYERRHQENLEAYRRNMEGWRLRVEGTEDKIELDNLCVVRKKTGTKIRRLTKTIAKKELKTPV